MGVYVLRRSRNKKCDSNIFSKEAKAVALQLRSPADWAGDCKNSYD